MKRLPSVSCLAATIAAVGALSAVAACGGISDPTRDGANVRVATVSGALTGMSVPGNTRVALVWKVGDTGSFAVGSDVAVVNGKFTMDLTPPPNGYFSIADEDYDSLSGATDSAPPVDSVPPTPGSGGSSGSSTSGGPGTPGTDGDGNAFALPNKLAPRDTVSGQIHQPLSAAFAGFVVYVDTNGNGKLDISGTYATATDEVIGGNKELLLAYLRDGGALDYEKLRDRSGILPQAGYNLAWEEGRWLPLNVVELKLTNRTSLPSAVCSVSDVHYDEPAPRPSSNSSGGPASPYPDPNDPNLTCSPDGRSFSYSLGCTEPEPQPVPEGLCAPYASGYDSLPCAGGGSGESLVDGEPVPEGWPCPTVDPNDQDGGAPDQDGGAAPDAGN